MNVEALHDDYQIHFPVTGWVHPRPGLRYGPTESWAGPYRIRTSESRLENEVEGCLHRPAEVTEARFLEHLPQAGLSRLGAEGVTALFGQGVGAAQRRRGCVIHLTDDVQIVLDDITREAFDEQDDPAVGEGTSRMSGGYEDASFFGRLFKRTVNLTPSAYRRTFRFPGTE